eukprot:3934780-Rhodomonas_salina.4
MGRFKWALCGIEIRLKYVNLCQRQGLLYLADTPPVFDWLTRWEEWEDAAPRGKEGDESAAMREMSESWPL